MPTGPPCSTSSVRRHRRPCTCAARARSPSSAPNPPSPSWERAGGAGRARSSRLRCRADWPDALGLSAPGDVRASAIPDATPVVPGGAAGRAWRALRADPSTPDALALRLGLGGAELARALVSLELDGLLAIEADGRLVA